MAVAVFAYAVTFGLLARDGGLSITEALLMSVFVYSGSAQVAAVAGMATGAGIIASVATVFLLNARYLLYGASLRPWLGRARTSEAYGTLFFLGDGNWVLSMKAHEDGEVDAGFIFGSGIAMALPWYMGTLIGAFSGAWIPEPEKFGLDFLLIAFCEAMAVGMLKSRADLWPAGIALVVSLGVSKLAPGGWTIVAAGLAGAAVAYLKAGNGVNSAP